MLQLDYKHILSALEKNLTTLEHLAELSGFEESLMESIHICIYWEAVCEKALEYAFYLSENSSDIIILKDISERYTAVRKKLMKACGGVSVSFEKC